MKAKGSAPFIPPAWAGVPPGPHRLSAVHGFSLHPLPFCLFLSLVRSCLLPSPFPVAALPLPGRGWGGALYRGTSAAPSPLLGAGGSSEPGLSGLRAVQPGPTPSLSLHSPRQAAGDQAQVGTARWPRLAPLPFCVVPSLSLALFLPLSVRLSVSVFLSLTMETHFHSVLIQVITNRRGNHRPGVCARGSFLAGGGQVSPAASRWAAPTAPPGPSPRWVGRTHSQAGLPGLGA